MSPTRIPPSARDFAVLLLEDGERVRHDMKAALERIDGVYVLEADSLNAASIAIDRHYIDAAVIDLKIKGVSTAGYEIIDELRDRAPNAPVVIATNHLGGGQSVARFVGSQRIVKIVNKQKEVSSRVAPPIEAVANTWRSRNVTVAGAKIVLDLVWKRQSRFPRKLRKTQRELGRELDRIYRALFGGVRGLEDQTDVKVIFTPIEREGLSAAITVEGEVTLGRDDRSERVRGSRCVVKIGPVEEIREEVERYDRFVKFGVRLAQRVELLSHAYDGRLGGIAYSFAGGVFGESLMSLDELLRRPDGARVAENAIEGLFDRDNKNWYSIECRQESPFDYVKNTYETDFDECFSLLHNSLGKLQQSLGSRGISFSRATEETPGNFSIAGGQLEIPAQNIVGSNAVYQSRPSCLVHGDMHGGNVMIELDGGDASSLDSSESNGLAGAELKRICLIDYRNAGPGPRTVDAVALQASIRLADVIAIAAEAQPAESSAKLTGAALEKAIRVAVSRAQAEASLFRRAWAAPADGTSVAHTRAQPWAKASAMMIARMRFTFPDVQSDEYIAMVIPCAIRQFGYDIGTLARLRLLAWLSATCAAVPAGDPE